MMQENPLANLHKKEKMEDNENTIELAQIPYGIEFEHEGRKYIAVGWSGTRTKCYDVTDLKKIQISCYEEVKVDPLIYSDIKNDNQFKDTEIERQLEIPIGELEKKKDTPEVRALLKIIKTFPFIVDVAEHKFDPDYAGMSIVKEMYERLTVEQLVEIFKLEKLEEDKTDE